MACDTDSRSSELIQGVKLMKLNNGSMKNDMALVLQSHCMHNRCNSVEKGKIYLNINYYNYTIIELYI